MATHTPGPWRYADTADGGFEVYPSEEQGDLGGDLIAGVWYFARPGDREQAEANARLIAAAPALLDALQVISGEAYQIARAWEHHAPMYAGRIMEMHDLARAAIAKAKPTEQRTLGQRREKDPGCTCYSYAEGGPHDPFCALEA